MPTDSEIVALNTVFTRDQLNQLLKAIENSGELGRSKIYSQLLHYLVDKGLAGQTPKEIEIALDVLGRDTDFDVSKDSAVRVYVHQLRKKLDHFYTKHDRQAPYRLVIPKGQYAVAAAKRVTKASADQAAGRAWASQRTLLWGVAALLVVNLGYGVWGMMGRESANPALEHAFWQPVVDDEVPLLVVVGDYYIFGELDGIGNISRMIREFDVNSKADLENKMLDQPEVAGQYRDLGLTYLPEGVAHGLNALLPLLHASGKPVEVRMMSSLSTQDVRSHHIVYLGYISGLAQLHTLVFTGSNLQVGEHYDQLINKQTGDTYTSGAGLPDSREAFKDYGLVSSLPVSEHNRLVVVAGMRDSGLIQAAQVVGDPVALTRLQDAVDGPQQALEALYEVRGMDGTNFAARQIYVSPIDPKLLWGEVLVPVSAEANGD